MTGLPRTLPAEDRALSPYTGWTRAHWETVADRLLAGVVPYATPDLAQYRLPGRASHNGTTSDGLEGFARTFVLAAFRIAGGAPAAVSDRLVERYAAGLAAGTDPASRYAWPAIADCSQQLVEASTIALALHETRAVLFDRLDEPVRDRVVSWLAGMVGRRTFDSNWRLFQVVTEEFLASVGGPHDRAEITAGLERIEDWYVGDGWYTDGDGQNFDYYAGWAMHLYPLLWCRMSGDTGREARYRDRLRKYLDQYQHLFAPDGAPVHQGRSLCYRFATVAPLWLGALVDATPLPPGRTRRLASGTLRHFVDRGAPDAAGLLGMGWYQQFLPGVQAYSGPASPYWGSKAFLGLLLPADHPAWTEPEEPAPNETADRVVAMPGPGWLLHATADDGVVRLLNHGSDRARKTPVDQPEDPHYARLAYSTHTGPELRPDGEPVDNHAAVLGPDGEPSRRRIIERIGTADRFAASAYTCELPDRETVRIETAAVVHGRLELRVHRVTAPVGATFRSAGYALASAAAPVARTGPGWASVTREDGLTGAVAALTGWCTAEAGVVRDRRTSAYGTHSAVGCLLRPEHPGGGAVCVDLVVLGTGPVCPAELGASLAVTTVADGAVITFADGEVVEVRLGPSPAYRRTPAGGGRVVGWSAVTGGQ